jgi:hypothetical protein
MDFTRKARAYANAPFCRQLMLQLLAGYKRPNDKISELLKSGQLMALKKGLYLPGPESDLPPVEPFVVANHLWGPSYVSLESALSYWGLIPERVYGVSSVSIKASKTYQTPVGRFSYEHLAAPYYSFGVQSVRLQPLQVALVASAEKALCDKIIASSGVLLRSVGQTMDFLLEDLRIEPEQLESLDWKAIQSWAEDAPKASSLRMLAKALKAL